MVNSASRVSIARVTKGSKIKERETKYQNGVSRDKCFNFSNTVSKITV